MDAKHLQRLKDEQDKALAAADSQLNQWKKFHADYIALKERLRSLPDKITHDVMVPFGSLAFMPGQFVHTNEILVLLGDNYFVECSAKQAVDIVTRRIQGVDEKIAGLNKQKNLLVPRADFTSEMIDMAQGRLEQHEITEPYDEENEKAWRERHREYLRKAGEKRQREIEMETEKLVNEEQPVIKSDEELWERLHQLERQEQIGQELEQLSDEESEVSQVSSSDDGEIGEDSDDEDETTRKCQRIITFSHTKLPQKSFSLHEHTKESDINTEQTKESEINTPADIYRLVQTGPRSILKTPKSSPADRIPVLEDGRQKSVQFVSEHQYEKPGRLKGPTVKSGVVNSEKEPEKAFRDVVVERPVVLPPSYPTGSVSIPSASGDAPLVSSASSDSGSAHCPVSGFKSSVQNQNIASVSLTDPTQMQQAGTMKNEIKVCPSRPMSKFRASRQKQGEDS